MILDERVDGYALSGEVGNHIRLSHYDLSIQDVVIGVVAMVDHKREVHHEACGVTLAIGTGVGFVRGQSVVGKEFVLALPVDDDASTRAFHFGSDVNPSADEVNILILKSVRVN